MSTREKNNRVVLEIVLEKLKKWGMKPNHRNFGGKEYISTTEGSYELLITRIGRFVSLWVRRYDGKTERWDFRLVPVFNTVPRGIQKQITSFL